jgi:hypothetical protein
VHAFGSVAFMQENMDIKDGFTTSSKQHLRSLVRVHELDEITSNGGKDRSSTKEYPRGLKRKRSNFMHGEPPYWTWGWHRQNHANGRGKMHNHLRTHGSKGATEPGRDGPLPMSVRPPFLAPEGFSTLKPWRRRHSQRGEPFAPGGHPQARERWERSPEEDRPPRRKHPQVEKKEDTVGRVTMINGAMSGTLTG